MTPARNPNPEDKPAPEWAFDDNGAVLRVAGVRELTAGNSTGFRDRVRHELRLRHQNIELDLSEIRFMDSQGLGVLIGLQKELLRRQGGLRVVNPTPNARRIFEITRMGRVFEISAGEETSVGGHFQRMK